MELYDHTPDAKIVAVIVEGVLTIPENKYDLIWAGSVFTHLSEELSRQFLHQLVRSLRPMGLFIFTTGGRLGAANLEGHLNRRDDQPYASYNMKDEEIRSILDGFGSSGYGYSDYHNQKGYGSALISTEWVQRNLFDSGVIQVLFQEMAWDTHQDVYGFIRIESSLVTLSRRKGIYF